MCVDSPGEVCLLWEIRQSSELHKQSYAVVLVIKGPRLPIKIASRHVSPPLRL